MKDREFLIWIHERLRKVHGENPLVDYMWKLRAVISSVPLEQETPNALGSVEVEDIPVSCQRHDLMVSASRRFLSLYDSGELTTEALRELASEMRKVVG